MSLSLSHNKPLDVGRIGLDRDRLPPFEEGPIDLHPWFGPAPSPPPLELEIGTGKGTFLVEAASRNPTVRYIGVEFAKAYWRYAADRCRRHGLENVRIVYIEAGAFVRQLVPDGCLRQVHIYFPDPWPKKRHHKRRLIQEGFLRDLHRTLQPGGLIRLATDHEDYYRWILEHAQRTDDLYERLPFESPLMHGDHRDPNGSGSAELVGTNFERKYRHEGRAFHAMMLRNRLPAPGEAAAEAS